MRNTEHLPFLFVGGPMDGQWYVPQRMDKHLCTELLGESSIPESWDSRPPATAMEKKEHLYTYAILGGSGKLYYLMLHESMGINEALERMFQVYSDHAKMKGETHGVQEQSSKR